MRESRQNDVLLIAPNWLGDSVMSLPLVGYLGALPGIRLRVVAPPYTARVFWGLDAVKELIVLPRAGRTRGVLARSRVIARLGVDGGVILPPSFSSALTLFLAGVRRRIGFDFDGRRLLLTSALPVTKLREEHLSENYLRLGRELTRRLHAGEAEQPVLPPVRVFDEERRWLGGELRSFGVRDGEYAVVVPGAMYGTTKTWPGDKYRTLVARLAGGVPVILAGGEGDRDLCDSIASDVTGAYSVAGRTSLGQLFALIEGARVLIANDSGAPHVAGSLGVPAVVIFGSTSPRWTRPLGGGVHVVREPVHCSPCFLSECPTQLECYEGIAPERVLESALAAMVKPLERAG